MSTNLINSIQHRNGPNQRPPNSIFGNADSNQKLLSNHLIYGLLGAVLCGVAMITFLSYSPKHDTTSYRMGVTSVVCAAVSIIILLVAGVFLIHQRRKQQVVVVCIEPNYTDMESNSLVFTDAPNVNIFENPPSYDHAVKMPSTNEKTLHSLPPSYDNIDLV